MEKNTKSFENPQNVRVRIAPSPTGFLHIGNARTALFNYLFAKRYGGKFVLRIEDTDLERSKSEYETDILESLKWLGILWDEGPEVDGEYGPYRQSEKVDIYEKYLKKLLNEDKAYYCFCSEEELETQRQYQMSRGEAPRYSGNCRDIKKEEAEKRLKKGESAVIRFKIDTEKKITFNDLIRGKIEVDSSLLGDIVIAKNSRTPLYNFAVVVDDYEMKITHVIRGEDHISNTPKQILLQEALGFPRPTYAHLSIILGPDRTKLSKRHGATSISDYRRKGYLPETMINFMAFLGWNPGTDKEIYSLIALTKEFSIKNCQKGGAIFNIKRLDWINGFYIRQKPLDKLTELCISFLVENGLIVPVWSQKELIVGLGGAPQITSYKIAETEEIVSFEYLMKIISLEQERMKTLAEIPDLTDFFFKKKLEYDRELLKWKEMTEKEIILSIDRTVELLSKLEADDFARSEIEKLLLTEAEKFSKEILKPAGDRGYLLWSFRVALTGKKSSAGPFEIAEVLGKEKTIERLRQAKNILS